MARPDYNRGSLMIVHISPRSYTLPQLFFFYTDISHTLFNFNVSLQFFRQPTDFPPLLVLPIPPPLFSFFFFFLHPFGLFSQSGSGTRASNFVRQDKLEISCATKYIYIYRQRFDSNIYVYILYVCVYRRGDNGISGRAGSLLNIRPLGAPAS